MSQIEQQNSQSSTSLRGVEGAGKNLTVNFDCYSRSSLESSWKLLEADGQGSFFQSWHWISHWLSNSEHPRHVVSVEDDGRIVALGILTEGLVGRPLGGTVGISSLHENARPEEDSISVEYNGLLCLPGYDVSVHRAVATELGTREKPKSKVPVWLEIRWPGCSDPVLQGIIKSGILYRLYRENESPFVNLSNFSDNPDTYFLNRSANTRHQTRRALRILELNGAPKLERASNSNEALRKLDELAVLHQETWTRRGKPGAFASEFFYNFHKSFVSKNIENGVVDLLTVQAGHCTVGVLYNFVYGGRVYAYQSGFALFDDNKVKPGLVCHTLAIQYYAGRNLEQYKFLAGDDRYKRSLATDSERLYWIALQKPDFQMRLENALRNLKAYVRKSLSS